MNSDIKSKLQQDAFQSLKDCNRVILKWATGCGKSKMCIDLINHQVMTHANGIAKILFVVAERAHIKNWQDEFEKWHLRFDRVAIDVCCYASLHKYKDNHYEILVLDEGHHAFTEKRMAALEGLKQYQYFSSSCIYLLSATLSSGKVDIIEDMFGKFTISEVSLKDAISKDILPDPKIFVVEMSLDNTTDSETIKIGNDPDAPVIKWENRSKYIYKKIPCIIKCTPFQKNLHITSDMEYWKRRYESSHNDFHRSKWVNLGSQRKRFLGELKTEHIRKLVSSFSHRNRYVCFCASVAQANSLSPTNTISSKRPAKLNQSIIDFFNKKKLNNIFAVGMITEGMNLKDIQTGVIVQLDGKERLFIQKVGRALRADSPVIYIFYYKGTQDEVYLKNALENIDSKYIKHCNLSDLNIQ